MNIQLQPGRRIATIVAVALVAVSACGGDDAASTTTAAGSAAASATTPSPTASADDAAPTATDAPATDAPAVPPQASLQVAGASVFLGNVVSCVVAEPEVSLTAQGETGELIVQTADDGSTAVSVTGSFEFTGNGTADFEGGSGKVVVAGTGTTPSDSTPVDFVLEVDSGAC